MNLTDREALRASFDTLRPLPQAALRNLHEEPALRWTYHSNAIEANPEVG